MSEFDYLAAGFALGYLIASLFDRATWKRQCALTDEAIKGWEEALRHLDESNKADAKLIAAIRSIVP